VKNGPESQQQQQ